MPDDTQPAPSPFHARATGIDGALLDSMLKARFTEGVEVGREEAAKAALKVIEDAKQQAFAEGMQEGTNRTRQAVTKELERTVDAEAREVRGLLWDIAKRSRGKVAEDISDIATNRLGRFYLLFR